MVHKVLLGFVRFSSGSHKVGIPIKASQLCGPIFAKCCPFALILGIAEPKDSPQHSNDGDMVRLKNKLDILDSFTDRLKYKSQLKTN